MSEPDRSRLPIRRETFAGVVDRTLAGSQPDWNLIEHPRPPDGAPNVLLVLIDDAGFGNPSTFGGPIQTPNYTRMAEGGLRYNRFHVTALCSPTRAALLTGRNNHTVGFGSIGEFAGGFPGYSANLPRDCAALPRILRDNGYSTAAFGKWHLTPDGAARSRGAVRPLAERLGVRLLLRDPGRRVEPVGPLPRGEPEDHRHARGVLRRGASVLLPRRDGRPNDRVAPRGTCPGRRQALLRVLLDGLQPCPAPRRQEWADRYKGQFDQGWDRLREETFARQKELGVIPADAELTPRDEAFPAWDDVPDNLKTFYARQMEVYAGYSENADHNVGRVIDAIEDLGELDNTLIIWIWGDNGASMEGTITGSFNELTMQNGIPLTDEMQLQLTEMYGGLDAWSSSLMAPHYGAAWAWAGNTPFQWGKQVGSHLGGTRNPLVVHWPAHVSDAGALRTPFTHVIDVAPTILDAAGIPAPDTVDGIEQEPMHGTSFVASLTDGAAPEHRTQQYFETVGNRAMYKDGWWLAMRTERIPWLLTPEALAPYAPGVWDPDSGPVELYYLPDDFTQANDLAAEHPEKVQELKDLFWQEAERYKVLPLLATLSTFFGILPPLTGETTFEFRGDVQNVMPGMIPRIYNRSYAITADLVVPEGGAEGVIVAEADHLGGFTLYVKDGKLTHTYSMMGVLVFTQVAEEDIPTGDVTVRMEFEADGATPATGGNVTLFIDGRPVGKGRMDHTVPVRFSGYAGMDIGRDNGGVVDRSYEHEKPFPFTGTIKKVVFDIKPHLSDQDELDLHAAEQHGQAAHGLSA